MFRTIRWRLIGSYLLVVMLAMAVAAGLAWRALDRAFLEVLRENLLAQARLVAQTVESERALEQGSLIEAAMQAIATCSQSVDELPGDLIPAVEADEHPRAEVYSQAANVAPGIHTHVLEADEQSSANAYPPDARIMADCQARVAEQDDAPSTDVYSQTLNVLPGYHTRVVDEDGAVVLDLGEIGESGSPEAPEWSQLNRVGGLASRLDLDTTGQVGVEPLRDRDEIQRAMLGEPATAVRAYSWAPDRRVLYAAYPIRSVDGTVSNIVYIASPLPRLSLSLLPSRLIPQVLGAVVLGVVLAGAAGGVLARTLTRPLDRLTGAAEALSRGGQAPPLPAAPTLELSRLTAAFNRMNANLSSARRELISRAEEQEIIFDGLSDSVIAANSAGDIVLTNPAGADLLEFAPDHLRTAIRTTLVSGEKRATEFAVRDRVIELTVSPLAPDDHHIGGVVAVGHDVTAHRQLDRLRTRFVSNVSHELRTPLTAIKGFVETLRDGAAEDRATRERFLHTIDTETDRLIRLASELLLLARADAGRLDLKLEPTDLNLVAERAVAQLAVRASAKDLTVAVARTEGRSAAHADPDRIQQVLINLLDNAVKFTPSGGSIWVSIRETGHDALCTVSDTGPGIPRAEIPHLFERFYRGDRSRARGEGESGAGLGLSIARSIVAAHGGRIWVASEPAAGTSVSFTLPLAG